MPMSLPGVYYHEEVRGVSSKDTLKIPAFIGCSLNKIENKKVFKYSSYKEFERNHMKNIGKEGMVEDSNSDFYKAIKEYFDTAKPSSYPEQMIPYIYVYDMGDEMESKPWLSALEDLEPHTDAIIEVYMLPKNATWHKEFLNAANNHVRENSVYLDFRSGYATIAGGSDNDLGSFNYSHIAAVSTDHFGVLVGQICITPTGVEPGFLPIKSIPVNTFTKRTRDEQLDLQNRGIIFGTDEMYQGSPHPRMNLAVFSNFNGEFIPADSMCRVRYIADEIARQIGYKLKNFVKDIESATTLIRMQSIVDKQIRDFVELGWILPYDSTHRRGTYLEVVEHPLKPYSVLVRGPLLATNSIIEIDMNVTVMGPF